MDKTKEKQAAKTISQEDKQALEKICLIEERNVAQLEVMFEDKLPPEALDLEVTSEINNKDSSKDQDV